MEKQVSVLLVGIGGYGGNYVDRLLPQRDGVNAYIVGAVDPFADKQFFYPALKEAGIPMYNTIDEFYAEHEADLAIVSTPIHFHREQSAACMLHGSHVLCEKPVAALIDDVGEMIDARDKSGKMLAIGFQWSYSEAVQALKRDVLAGKYGKLLRMKTIVLWPRTFSYYARGSGWAGHKKTKSGAWVLDSVASNATAHYLHNMLYVAGNKVDTSATAETIEVETYRANDIETFDTCAMRLKTTDGVEMLYLVTHAVDADELRNPEFVFEFENGSATAKEENDEIVIRGHLNDGTEICYGEPNANGFYKLYWMINAVRDGGQVLCGPEAACEHTKCVNRIAELIPETPVFPESQIVRKTENVYCKGLAKVFSVCYDEWKLPCETDFPGFKQAVKGTIGKDYRHFAG